MSNEKEVNSAGPAQEGPEIIGKVEISILNNGQVTVKGPVNNSLLMMEIFGRAMEAVVTHIANDQSNGIVVQDQKIMNLN